MTLLLDTWETAAHEAGHAALAVVLDLPWHLVTIHETEDTAGRLLPDTRSLMAALDGLGDRDARWLVSSFAVMRAAGPLAQARWVLGRVPLPREMDWRIFGGTPDRDALELLAIELGVPAEHLIADATEMLDTDKVWLAVCRVAEALIEHRMLGPVEVARLVGKRQKEEA